MDHASGHTSPPYSSVTAPVSMSTEPHVSNSPVPPSITVSRLWISPAADVVPSSAVTRWTGPALDAQRDRGDEGEEAPGTVPARGHHRCIPGDRRAAARPHPFTPRHPQEPGNHSIHLDVLRPDHNRLERGLAIAL